MTAPLAGRCCLVTGATGTLGRALARRLRLDGAGLLLAGRSQARLDALAEEVRRDIPGDAALSTVAADLAEDDGVERVIAAARAGGVGILINNAAIQGPIGPLTDCDWATWQQAIRVDLLVPVALCRALTASLAGATGGGRGKIINISGGGATGPRPRFTAYGTAKAALVRFTESFAAEAVLHRVDINAVAPGAMASALTREIAAAGGGRAGEREADAAETLLREGGDTPDKAAALCSWLASAASDGIGGRLLAALWDPWPTLDRHVAELAGSDIYTLRRITPADRGKSWEEER